MKVPGRVLERIVHGHLSQVALAAEWKTVWGMGDGVGEGEPLRELLAVL